MCVRRLLLCTSTPDGGLTISCVWAQSRRRAAAQVAPDTGISAHAHTTGSRESLPSRELPPPPASLPPPEWLLMENLPTVPNRPNFSHIIFVGGICGGITDLMSNISATCGRPDMRFCVCESPRGDLSHIAGLTLGRSRSDFSGANRRAQEPYMWGGRTDTTNRLSENHL